MASRNGFTLIEILIAITLLAFISLGVISVVNNSIDTKERVVSEDNEKMQLLVGLSRLEWDFAHIYSPLYHGRFPDPNKATSQTEKDVWQKEAQKMQHNQNFFALSTEKYPIPTIRQDGPSELMFFSMANRRRVENVKESEYAWIHYQLTAMSDGEEKNKGLSQLARTFITVNPFTPEQIDVQEGDKSQVVMERIKEFKFEFWDRDQKKYVASLKDMKETVEKNLIRSAKISFTWVDSKGIEEKFVRFVRPLFPYFEEEDLTSQSSSSTNQTSAGTSSESSSSSTDESTEDE